MKKISKRILFSALLVSSLFVAVFGTVAVLMTPWYPVVRSETIRETFTYSYELPRESHRTRSVYTLPNPMMLKGLFQPYVDYREVYKDLEAVDLQTGWIIHVDVTQCGNCYMGLYQNFGNGITVFTVQGSASDDFIVPQSGRYEIYVDNLGDEVGWVNAIRITADVPETSSETQLGYNTITYTTYSVSNDTPLRMLILPSLTPILLEIAITVILLAIFCVMVLMAVRSTRRRRAATEAAAKLFCINCGTELPPDSRTCSKCGASTS